MLKGAMDHREFGKISRVRAFLPSMRGSGERE